MVLTGQGGRFSAELDLGEHFPIFGGPEGVAEWFAAYRATNMRLFTYPRPVVAAVNGHAFAGGLVTAAGCDRRVAVDSGARFALNEVPIGIPMPPVYVWVMAYAWGEKVAAQLSLFVDQFDSDRARALGVVDEHQVGSSWSRGSARSAISRNAAAWAARASAVRVTSELSRLADGCIIRFGRDHSDISGTVWSLPPLRLDRAYGAPSRQCFRSSKHVHGPLYGVYGHSQAQCHARARATQPATEGHVSLRALEHGGPDRLA